MLSENDLDKAICDARELQSSNRHDDAIALLNPLVDEHPQDMRLRRTLALVLGGKVERMLENADRLGITPDSEELDRMEENLVRGSELDPQLADLHWDRAVIQARFRGNFDEATAELNRAKQLGYAHPMMQRLEALIRDRDAVGNSAESPSIITLLHKLVDQASGKPGIDILFEDVGLGDFRTLDEYCSDGFALAAAGKISQDDFMLALDFSQDLGGDVGEVALDFLRRVAGKLGDAEIERIAGNAHLAIVAEMAQFLGSRPDMDDRAIRKARRCANRGMDIVDSADYPVDPEICGDLLIALGQTFSRSTQQDLGTAIPIYVRALDQKEAAGNSEHVGRLRRLLAGMVEAQMQQTQLTAVVGIGGFGEAVGRLRAAHEAAYRLEDRDLIVESGLGLAEALGGASQLDEAVEVLERIAGLKGLSAKQMFSIDFTLAARLSETKRPAAIRRARGIGEEQVKLLDTDAASVDPQTVWMNLGNFRRLDGDLVAARQAFRDALARCPETKPNEVPLQLGQIKMLLAEAELLLGKEEESRQLITETDKIFAHASGLGKLHFESIAARLTWELGDAEASARHAARGIAVRRFILADGPSPSVWESMLQEWTRLDVAAVRAYHATGAPESLERALLVAETAKGRLFAWLARVSAGQEAAAHALEDERQIEALAAVREWTEPGNRWMVSLFGHREGLSVIGIGPESGLVGAWFDGFDYDDLRLRSFEPWERGLRAGLEERDDVARALAGSVTEFMLARVGDWLARAVPQLAKGGEELVLLPHRLFRSLPLAYAELPGGARLSDRFTRVSICPSLAEFGRSLKRLSTTEATLEQRAVVDSDGTLPFARVEGLASVGTENVVAGDEVSVEVIESALSAPGILLLSCHGDFDEGNPWQSVIRAADGKVVLGELLERDVSIASQLVVLGVCEAGKSRRSLSDEPLSFPTLLTDLGARLVIAPSWQVEDFSSYLLVTRLLREIKAGVHAAQALTTAARGVRDMTAREALTELEGIKDALEKGTWPLAPQVTEDLVQRVAEYERWLNTALAPNEYPFDALDWAAFQAYGYTSKDK
jgi:CHAT domain-containing protein/tetratricopeptide (TPR) repeat protein